MSAQVKVAFVFLIVFLLQPHKTFAVPFYLSQLAAEGVTDVYVGFGYDFPSKKFFDSNRDLVSDPLGGKYYFYNIFISAERGLIEDTSVGIEVSVTHNEVSGAFYEDENDFRHTLPYGFLLSLKHHFISEEHYSLGAKARLLVPFSFERDPAPHRWGDGRFGSGGSVFFGLLHPAYLAEIWTGAMWYDEKPKARLDFGVRGRYFVVLKYLYLNGEISGEEPFVQNQQNENPFADTVSEQSSLNGIASIGSYLLPFDTFVESYYRHSILGRHYPLTREIGLVLGFVF
ncbi:MAG: hypothetical protein PHQ00_07125 [Phycisphaerae bacterium]|nr:hypothetical protein [Phycisphaerae bacterium]